MKKLNSIQFKVLLYLILFGIVPMGITSSAAVGIAVSAVESAADTDKLAEVYYAQL